MLYLLSSFSVNLLNIVNRIKHKNKIIFLCLKLFILTTTMLIIKLKKCIKHLKESILIDF